MFKLLKTFSFALLILATSQSFASYSDSKFFVEADLLVWQPHLEGSNRLINVEADADSSTDSFGVSNGKQRYKKFDFDWRTGYRVGLGYNLCSNWVLEGFWTHYRGHGSKQFRKFDLSAHGHWDMDYDVVDVLLETPMCCACNCFDWNVFGGLKVALIDSETSVRNPFQSASTSIDIVESTTSTMLTFSKAKDKERFYFHGFGPEFGVNTRYNCGCGFSIFGKAAGSLVFAHFKNRSRTLNTSNNVSAGRQIFQFESRFKNGNDDFLCRPVLDLSLGLEWESNLACCNCDSTLVCKLAWEHHQWFGFNRITTGDLYLDGVTLSALLKF